MPAPNEGRELDPLLYWKQLQNPDLAKGTDTERDEELGTVMQSTSGDGQEVLASLFAALLHTQGLLGCTASSLKFMVRKERKIHTHRLSDQ